MLVQFLGTTGIIAIRVVTSVVAIQRTRGAIAVVRIDAETQSQRWEYRSCRHNDGSTAISRFRRSGPNARLDRGAGGFLLPPRAARHVTTCRSGMILFVFFAYSYFYFFVCLFTLSRYGPSCRRLLSGGDCIAFFAAAPLLRPTALSSRGPGHDQQYSDPSCHKGGCKTTNAGRKCRRSHRCRNAKPALSSC